MDTNKLKFYLALSRLPLLQNSYPLKILSIASIGLLIPLLTFIRNTDWYDSQPVFIISAAISYHFDLNGAVPLS